MENLPGRGFGATCRACVLFAWEIVRDSPMKPRISQLAKTTRGKQTARAPRARRDYKVRYARNNLVKHLQRQQFSFTKTSIKVPLYILSL